MHFNESPFSTDEFDKLYKYSLKNAHLMRFDCTNGTFFINPSEISDVHMTADQPLEKDQL